MCAHMCVGGYIYIHTHTCIGAHTHVCVHVCAYIQLTVSQGEGFFVLKNEG